MENQTVWGPGANAPCSGPYQMGLFANGPRFGDIPLMGPGNFSDKSEPTSLGPWNSNITLQNGFAQPNAANVTTCGGSARSVPGVTSTFLTQWVSFIEGGQTHTVALPVPLIESVYHYLFPANFGTWQVDNLSAPGGPGGGWAFNFVAPCA